MHYITDKFIFCKLEVGGGGGGGLMFGTAEKETLGSRDLYFRFSCIGISVNFNC